jgi:hypothetical protein
LYKSIRKSVVKNELQAEKLYQRGALVIQDKTDQKEKGLYNNKNKKY